MLVRLATRCLLGLRRGCPCRMRLPTWDGHGFLSKLTAFTQAWPNRLNAASMTESSQYDRIEAAQ